MDNAIKYAAAEGRVRLSLWVEGDRALMEVADSGAGIAPEDVAHIFERFYRADRARRSGGTGLGLSIARWIVDEHGGDIRVVTEPGHGSVFTVAILLTARAPALG